MNGQAGNESSVPFDGRFHDGDAGGARRGVVPAIFAIAFAAGFLLCGYEFIRSPSTSMYIAAYGADRLPYAMLAGAVVTVLFLWAYGWLLSLAGPRRTLLLVSLFSGVAIFICYVALRHGSKLGAGAAYAFREAYIVVVIEQYWSFINSTLSERQAKRWNGFICGVGSLGAIAGGYATGFLADKGGRYYIGTDAILLVAAASLLPAALCSELSYRLAGEPAASPREQTRGRSGPLALRLFVGSSYLRRIGLLIVLTQAVSTALDLGFFALVENAFPLKDARTAYMGMFYGKLNLCAGAMQFIATPLLLGLVRLKFILPAIPIIHVAAAGALIVRPSLLTGGLAYLVFKVVDYSVFRAGKEMLYMPLSFDGRYRAKEVIDAFGYRASKGLAAGLASVARLIWGVLPFVAYPLAAAAGAMAWLITVAGLVRLRERMPKDNVFSTIGDRACVALSERARRAGENGLFSEGGVTRRH